MTDEKKPIETTKKILVVGKESAEVADALAELVKDIKAGKDVATIASENLPSVMKAVDGFEQLDDEMKDKSRNATIAYSGYVMAEALAPVTK